MSLTAAPRTTRNSAFLPPKTTKENPFLGGGEVNGCSFTIQLRTRTGREVQFWTWPSSRVRRSTDVADIIGRSGGAEPKWRKKTATFLSFPHFLFVRQFMAFFRPPRRVQTETICWEILWSTWIEQEIKWIMLNDFGLMQSEMRIGPKVSCRPLIPSV